MQVLGCEWRLQHVARKPTAASFACCALFTPNTCRLQACTQQWRGDVLFIRHCVASCCSNAPGAENSLQLPHPRQMCGCRSGQSHWLNLIPLVGPVSPTRRPWEETLLLLVMLLMSGRAESSLPLQGLDGVVVIWVNMVITREDFKSNITLVT